MLLIWEHADVSSATQDIPQSPCGSVEETGNGPSPAQHEGDACCLQPPVTDVLGYHITRRFTLNMTSSAGINLTHCCICCVDGLIIILLITI
jgi:hypothetical protein